MQDISFLIEDCPHTTAPDEGSGYPLVRTPNIGEGYLILEGVHRVSEETYHKRNVRAVPQTDDIVYAREAPAGNAAVIKKEEIILVISFTVMQMLEGNELFSKRKTVKRIIYIFLP